MNQTHFLSQHPYKYLFDEKKVGKDVLNTMFFRYMICIFGSPFLCIFHNKLPFPFPHFFLVTIVFFVANLILHLFSLNKTFLKKTYYLLPYFDAGFAPVVIFFTGGFLSPLVIAHFVTTIGSGIVYSSNKKIPLHCFIILFFSYLTIAILQKTGIAPCYIGYVQQMMANDFFFYFITISTSLIILMGFVLVNILNAHVYQMFDDIIRSFDSIIKGTLSVVGQDFFPRLAQYLCQALSARCSIIAELTDKGQSFKTLAVWKDGKPDENFESPIENTVFADVLSQKKCIVEDDASNLFHTNPLLAECNTAFFSGAVLNDTKGNPIGLLCIVNDKPIKNMHLVEPSVSVFASRAAAELERIHNEKKQKVIETQLAHAHKMSAIGQLVSGIAHDFNNMVSAISGCAQLLHIKIGSDSPHQCYIKHILDANQHTADMIGQLTRFSRRDKPDSTLVNINNIVEEIVELMRKTINKKITITKELSNEPTIAHGDNTLLANVLLNLGINARDAMEEQQNGVLSFVTSIAVLDKNSLLCESFRIPMGDYIRIDVTDTGIGMSKDMLAHIFEPFFTTKPKGKGTGLGLSNVWNYIENYKGAIEVKSESGKGTTFTMYFSLTSEVNKPRVPEAFIPVGGNKRDGIKCVLVADDEPAMRNIVAELLKNNGYTVFTAKDGIQAVDFISKNNNGIDLVILDVMMPAMNGPDAFKAIRKINPAMRFIMISGFINKNDLKDIMNETLTAFVQKPFSDEQMLGAIRLLSATV
ncbi:MAG TPA: hypothetical protein DCO75_10150 [Fibrobacteres bacterium]|nr:hypothetical protein [Fibrobacterota bacterium]